MAAKVSKWQIGSGALTWLGLCISPGLGLAWVPRAKVLRCVRTIDSVLDGSSEVAEYRRLLGLPMK